MASMPWLYQDEGCYEKGKIHHQWYDLLRLLCQGAEGGGRAAGVSKCRSQSSDRQHADRI